MDPAAIGRLRAALTGGIELADSSWAQIESRLEPCTLAPGEHLIRAGEQARRVGFVVEGAVREYFVTPDGREFNKAFCFEDELTGSLYDLVSGEPSLAAIEALEPTSLLTVPYAELRQSFTADPSWQRALRVVTERLFLAKARREYELLTMSARQRYEALLATRPDLEQRVAQYHVASLLGVTAEALSRIRRRMENDG